VAEDLSILPEGGERLTGTPDRLSVCLVASEAEEDSLRRALGASFVVSSDPDAPAGLFVLGAAHAADSEAFARLWRRAEGRPILVIAPASATADRVRDLHRAGASAVIFEPEIADGLAEAARALLEQGLGSDGAWIAAELGKRARDLEEALDAVRDAYDQTLAALVTALDHRERETACHSQRVALFALRLGIRLDITGEPLEDLYRGALLHDIGKIAIPDAILLKPGALTQEEWGVMRSHTRLGSEMVGRIAFLRRAADVPLAHHEAWDGNGYPHGLRDTQIPLHARIFAVVDTYDAVRSERPYKEARDHDAAIEALREAAGVRLDPELVRAFTDEPSESWDRLARSVEGGCTYTDGLRACRGLDAR
jgi:response regulator RpfG family c-di-GMP phosphodiesterase